jgi:hypothetical protein
MGGDVHSAGKETHNMAKDAPQEPAHNTAEVDAAVDHATEKAEKGGKDPIGSEKPDWVDKDMPDPKNPKD